MVKINQRLLECKSSNFFFKCNIEFYLILLLYDIKNTTRKNCFQRHLYLCHMKLVVKHKT